MVFEFTFCCLFVVVSAASVGKKKRRVRYVREREKETKGMGESKDLSFYLFVSLLSF